MGEFFARDYSGAPFELFGTAHLVGLGVIALFILILILLRERISPAASRGIRYAMAGGLLVVETSWHLWNAFTGQWTLDRMLPLHLCSILVWLSIYMLVTRSQRIYEISYLLGIAGALQALLTPDAGIYGFPHFRFFQALASHGLLVSAAIYMTVVEKMRPTWASVRRVMISGLAYTTFVWVINWLTGGNYLFIARKPDTASLLDVLPAWPWYIPIVLGLGFFFILLFYTPFAVKDWLARGKPAKGSA